MRYHLRHPYNHNLSGAMKSDPLSLFSFSAEVRQRQINSNIYSEKLFKYTEKIKQQYKVHESKCNNRNVKDNMMKAELTNLKKRKIRRVED